MQREVKAKSVDDHDDKPRKLSRAGSRVGIREILDLISCQKEPTCERVDCSHVQQEEPKHDDRKHEH